MSSSSLVTISAMAVRASSRAVDLDVSPSAYPRSRLSHPTALDTI